MKLTLAASALLLTACAATKKTIFRSRDKSDSMLLAVRQFPGQCSGSGDEYNMYVYNEDSTGLTTFMLEVMSVKWDLCEASPEDPTPDTCCDYVQHYWRGKLLFDVRSDAFKVTQSNDASLVIAPTEVWLGCPEEMDVCESPRKALFAANIAFDCVVKPARLAQRSTEQYCWEDGVCHTYTFRTRGYQCDAQAGEGYFRGTIMVDDATFDVEVAPFNVEYGEVIRQGYSERTTTPVPQ